MKTKSGVNCPFTDLFFSCFEAIMVLREALTVLVVGLL